MLFDHRTQYQSFVLPFLFTAAMAGYDRVALRRPGQWPKGVLVGRPDGEPRAVIEDRE